MQPERDSMETVGATQNSPELKEGMSEVLNGCAMCCDGIRKEAESAGLPQDVIQDLDQAIRICRDVAGRLRR